MTRTIPAWLACAAAMLSLHPTALAQSLQPARISAGELGQLPTSTSPSGTQQTAILGAASGTGIYVVRAKFPAGLKIQPHFHPDDRVVVVLSGTVYVGYGERFDESGMRAMPAGSTWTEPAGQAHYTWAKDGEAVIQIVGHGPSGITMLPQN
ncbi:cupin domain-containing protein [Pseudoduganella sp. UC29_106]|uniref:cupin domain-containing protein n=1 Tax=Pseudoduganella sp. UC29_106 TaxID=3374553 RepID=UPI00375740EC